MLAYNCRDERNHPYLHKSPSEDFSYVTSVNQINTIAKIIGLIISLLSI